MHSDRLMIGHQSSFFKKTGEEICDNLKYEPEVSREFIKYELVRSCHIKAYHEWYVERNEYQKEKRYQVNNNSNTWLWVNDEFAHCQAF